MSHWDYADEFTGREAAHLIAGFDPSSRDYETEYKILPIIKRMKKSYYRTVSEFVFQLTTGAGFTIDEKNQNFATVNPLKRRTASGDELWSAEIETLIANYNAEYRYAMIPEEFEFSISDKVDIPTAELNRRAQATLRSYFDDEHQRVNDLESTIRAPLFSWALADIHEFEEQRFSRDELRRWTAEIALPTEYKFAKKENSQRDGEKSLTTTERNTLLVIIAALCKKATIEPAQSTATAEVVRLVDGIGVTLSDDTIRKVLKKIPDVLASRRK